MAFQWPFRDLCAAMAGLPPVAPLPTATAASGEPATSFLALSPQQFDQLLGDFTASLHEVRRLKEALQQRRTAVAAAAAN